MTHVWKPQRPQVQDKEDIEEDVDAAGRERKIELMWIKCVNRRRSSEWNTGAAQKVKPLRTINLSEQRSRWLKHEKRSIKMGMPWSMEEDDEGRNGKQQCDNVLLLVEPVVKKKRKNTEEIGTASSLHHTCQACDHHTRGHPNYLTVYVVKKLQRNNKTSIHGAEL